MSSEIYKVERSRLAGQVRVSGAKNSALRLLVASLLTPEPVHLSNYPDTLLDAQVQVDMLRALGKRCEVAPGGIVVSEERPPASRFEYAGRSIRNTLLMLGALTARTGAGAVPLPGGCRLGERKYDIHVQVLEALGARVWEENGRLCAAAPRGLRGAEVRLPLRSTGATENAILAATLARGTTRIWNPHVRPEILDLVAMLVDMGAEIEVRGQESILVRGRGELGGVHHRVVPDNVEALTWLIGAVITGGDVEIAGFPADHLEVPLIYLRESGASFSRSGDRLVARGGQPYPVDIATGPYPGINSDMQPLFAVYGACAAGQTSVVDLRFPGRYGYAEELGKMGVEYQIAGDMLRIAGGRRLHGAEVTALDLRAGVALVLAGLVAEGTTRVADAWQIERGYDRFVEKMNALGGRVVRQAAGS
ncbi:MAG TPA: UDP-N-acetylglucosamine 1-carboxyvinyltransferase [Kiritimatiellia bacterium]|nr:UDP-N-acetylglucosamine 1-carboxyvinyltransferase [Kiritimatiellia bacterium]